MLVITQDTGPSFAKEIDICLQSLESWRCLLFKFSQARSKPDKWFSALLERVSTCLGDDGTKAYLYPDGDVHILVKHATQKSFTVLTGQLTDLAGFNAEPICELLEVKIDIETIRSIIDDKKPASNSPAPPISQAAVPVVSRSIYTDKSYREELTSSLSLRRRNKIRPSILVVEDDPMSLHMVKKSLGSEGDIYMAADGKSALEACLVHAPDVIFLDIGLPDVNGLELMDQIYAADPNAYIVILSGNGTSENVMTAVQKGAKGFVAKPFSKEKLLHYISKSPTIRSKTLKA